MLAAMDKGRSRLQLIDISADDFDPSPYNRTHAQLMGEIHGVTPEGDLITGVEVFRRAYAAVGWGWLLGWTRWPGVRWISDRCYDWFARHRLRLTGRGGACGASACAPQK